MFVSAQYKDCNLNNMRAIPARPHRAGSLTHVEVAVASKRFAIASVCVAVVVGVFLFPKAPVQKKKLPVDPLAARPAVKPELGPLPAPAGGGGIAQVSGQH
jgi:hypothetical protein